jgi:hypothetical protein
MQAKGKIIGGIIGMFLLDRAGMPLGGLVGFFFGMIAGHFLIDLPRVAARAAADEARAHRRRQGVVIFHVFRMCAKIAKSDGRVNQAEVLLMEKLMVQHFRLSAAGRQEAFVVPRPAELEQLQQVWRTRFLRHHDPAFVWPEGAAVVRSYSEQLLQGLRQWLQRPGWHPLQQVLRELPEVPLTIRLDGVSEALGALPWEALALQRPIWRLDGSSPANAASATTRARQPRMLLLVGVRTMKTPLTH